MEQDKSDIHRRRWLAHLHDARDNPALRYDWILRWTPVEDRSEDLTGALGECAPLVPEGVGGESLRKRPIRHRTLWERAVPAALIMSVSFLPCWPASLTMS